MIHENEKKTRKGNKQDSFLRKREIHVLPE